MAVISGEDKITEGFKLLQEKIKPYTLVWESSSVEAIDIHE